VDDDNYVNLQALLRLLASYRHSQDVYLGKPSLDRPIQATERVSENTVVSAPTPTVHVTPHTAPQGRMPGISRHFLSPSVLSTSGLPPVGLASASAEGWL
jgi:hypothetical protein